MVLACGGAAGTGRAPGSCGARPGGVPAGANPGGTAPATVGAWGGTITGPDGGEKVPPPPPIAAPGPDGVDRNLPDGVITGAGVFRPPSGPADSSASRGCDARPDRLDSSSNWAGCGRRLRPARGGSSSTNDRGAVAASSSRAVIGSAFLRVAFSECSSGLHCAVGSVTGAARDGVRTAAAAPRGLASCPPEGTGVRLERGRPARVFSSRPPRPSSSSSSSSTRSSSETSMLPVPPGASTTSSSSSSTPSSSGSSSTVPDLSPTRRLSGDGVRSSAGARRRSIGLVKLPERPLPLAPSPRWLG